MDFTVFSQQIGSLVAGIVSCEGALRLQVAKATHGQGRAEDVFAARLSRGPVGWSLEGGPEAVRGVVAEADVGNGIAVVDGHARLVFGCPALDALARLAASGRAMGPVFQHTAWRAVSGAFKHERSYAYAAMPDGGFVGLVAERTIVRADRRWEELARVVLFLDEGVFDALRRSELHGGATKDEATGVVSAVSTVSDDRRFTPLSDALAGDVSPDGLLG
jgi:hypothetical protein